jgi:NhaP-type Na+/H+ or K+/H+ antiporter
MNIPAVVTVALALLAYGLVSQRLRTTPLTGPLLFTLFGLALGDAGFGLVRLDMSEEILHLLAEVTLILVLFADAASIDLRQLRKDHNLPLRMLVIGMPLTILLGTGVALVLFPSLSLWEAALLAAILAPTDAALGQAVVASPVVPTRIRLAINVESGLNDGIALPLVLLFGSLAAVMAGSEGERNWIQFGLLQITLGPVVGVAVGWVGARLVARAHALSYMSDLSEGIIALALAFLAFGAAELVHGNGFISAFVAGLTFGHGLARKCTFLYEFAEAEGQFLILMTFLIFGGAMLPMIAAEGLPMAILFGLLALTVLRMLPVAVALAGTRVRPITMMFLGWFGPRGLASVLFLLLILEETDIPGKDLIFSVVVCTVFLSIVLHGLTAGPGSRWFGAAIARVGKCPEAEPVPSEPFSALPVDPGTAGTR